MDKRIAGIVLCMWLSACSGGGGGSSEPERVETEGPQLIQTVDYLLGPHGWRGIQDFTYVNGELYTLHHSSDETTINRFEGDEIAGYSVVGAVAGHQGLAHDGRYFWSTAYHAKGKAVKFSYEDGEPLQTVARYKLFSKSNVSSTPAVGGGYVAAQGLVNGQRVVRIWYLDTFNESGDYSYQYLYQWPIADAVVQGIATDGDKVWIISGLKEESAKPIHTYSLSGQLLKTQSVTIGMTGSGWYEPEGLSMLKGKLVFAMVTGTAKDRSTQFFSL